MPEQCLTVRQLATLKRCEHAIAKTMFTSYYEVGKQLAVIKEKELYTDTAATFVEYCRERWGFGVDYANRLIRAAGVVSVLLEHRQDKPQGSSYLALPPTEKEVRALSKVQPDQIPEVWEEVIDRAPKDAYDNPVITSAHVSTTVDRWLAPDDEVSSNVQKGQEEPAEDPEVDAASVEEPKKPSRAKEPDPDPDPDPDRLFFEGLEVSIREWINNDPVRLVIAVESLDALLDELRTD